MRTQLFASIAAATLGVGLIAGCSSDSPEPMDPSSMSTMPSMDTAEVDADFNMADVMFARMMYPHHAQAIEMAEMVDGRTDNPELIALAAEIEAAQQPEMDQMVTWLEEWGQPGPAPSMGGMPDMGGMNHGSGSGMMSDEDMASLTTLSGAELDREWLTMMIEHHEGAIEMAESEISDGSNPDVVEMARNIVTTQRDEIARMEQLLG